MTLSAVVAGAVPPNVYMVSNTVTIADDGSNGPDLNPPDNTYTKNTPLYALPDLAVYKSDQGAFPSPGQTLIYVLNYDNHGTRTSTGIGLTETVPANTTFNAGASSPGWVCVASTCRYTDTVAMNPGDPARNVLFAVTLSTPWPAGVNTITNTVKIADNGSNGPDPNIYDNTATVYTFVNARPDMAVAKTDFSQAANAGQTIVYSVFYTNTGNQTATGVKLWDTIPVSTTFVGPASWISAGTTITGQSVYSRVVGTVLPGASGSVTIAVQVASVVPASLRYITNTVTIVDDYVATAAPPTPANDTAIDIDVLNANPDLWVNKSDSGPSSAGSYITYTITYGNRGHRDAVERDPDRSPARQHDIRRALAGRTRSAICGHTRSATSMSAPLAPCSSVSWSTTRCRQA